MYCKKCGIHITNESKFCSNCGYRVETEKITARRLYSRPAVPGNSAGADREEELPLSDRIFNIATVVAIGGLFLVMVTSYLLFFVVDENGPTIQNAIQNEFKENVTKVIKRYIENGPEYQEFHYRVTQINILKVSGSFDEIRSVKAEIETAGRKSKNILPQKFIKIFELNKDNQDNNWRIVSSYDDK